MIGKKCGFEVVIDLDYDKMKSRNPFVTDADFKRACRQYIKGTVVEKYTSKDDDYYIVIPDHQTDCLWHIKCSSLKSIYKDATLRIEQLNTIL